MISESFALNLYISIPLKNTKLFALLWYKLRQNILFCSVKLIEYTFSTVSVVSSNPSVWLLPGIKIYFFIVIMRGWTHIGTNYYYVFAKSTTITQWKGFVCIISITIPRIFLLIDINIFYQFNSTKQRNS